MSKPMTSAGGTRPTPTTHDLILIGTERTCSQLADMVRGLASPPRVVAHLVTDGPSRGRLPGADLGPVETLDVSLGAIDAARTVALVCLPAVMRSVVLRVRAILERAGVATRGVEAIEDIIAGRRPPAEPGMSRVAEYTPLIGRTPYGIDRRAVSRVIEGRRVLITGAGGSIGSEIARIVAGFAPSAILLMDRSENALFEVNRRIGDRFPGLDRRAILHDVVDAPGTRRHLHSFEPHVVFHAAAHKHVPLMEDHPYQAVANNFYGTRSIADAALACGAERFVLISSDKAVKPTSVMGATKRLAEMYTQALHRSVWSADGKASAGSPPRTAFCMVRFGNVLGSACSVLPIWSSQVAEGGPVTVTDTRMTRYFMTIEEAAALVIQAGAIDTTDPTAHVYVLDMGRPVRILDLARRFVRSMGFWPDVQDADGRRMPEWIPEEVDPAEAPMIIRITGARPGEKLHEELAYAAELVKPTPYAGINAWAGPTTEARSLDHLLNDLSAITPTSRREDVVEVLRRYVPELPERKIDANQNTNTPAQSAGNADLKPNIEPVTA